jgi:two-component system response regulator YesN
MYQVMLVDDSEVMLKEICRLKTWQETSNFMVSREARNGQEALRKLADASVDLVITDIRMPKVNGLELLQKIMEQGLAKLVVLLSEYQEFSYARQGLVSGAFDYLVKPVREADLKMLLARVSQYLGETAAKERRLRQLEEQVAKSPGAEYLAFEIRKLAEYVVTGNFQTEAIARNLVLIVSENLDFKKIEIIVQKATVEIVTKLEQEYPWLANFLNFELIRRVDYTALGEAGQLADAFVGLLVALIRKIKKLKLGDGRSRIVEQTCRYVLEHLNPNLTIQRLAKALFLHRSYLSEVFKRQTGMRLNEYIRLVKLERAKKMIRDGRLLNYQIAGQLGFKDVEYFSRLFKKYTGMLLSEYKESPVTIL